MSRATPNVVVRHPSPNYSSRGGAPIQLIVVHATEGHNRPNSASDLVGLGNFFGNPGSQVSSHVATDGDGNSLRCVLDRYKAWHVAYFNPPALGIEQIWASGDKWNVDEYRETARWIARWSIMYGIPIRKAVVDHSTGHVVSRGVVRHSDLGILGGNHNDPGNAYNMHLCLGLARFYSARLRGHHA